MSKIRKKTMDRYTWTYWS